jgi:PAS domain S-box-containing protein
MPLLNSFSARVFFSLVSAMVILFSIVNYLNNRAQTRAFEEDIIKDGTVLTRVTANAARLGLFAENTKLLRSAVRPTLLTEGVLAIYVMNPDKEILLQEQILSTGRQLATGLFHMPKQKQKQHLQKIAHSSDPVVLDGDEIMEFWTPVRGVDTKYSADTLYFAESDPAGTRDSRLLGFVGVVMDKAPLKEGLRAIAKRNMLLMMLSFFLVAVITFFIVSSVTKPLTSLTNRVKSHRLASAAQDDLGMLSFTYDSLIRELGQSFDIINDLNDRLASKVTDLQQEIERRLKTDAALRESEGKYRGLVETLNDIVYTTDLQGNLTYVSQSATKLAGFTPGELTGKNFIDLVNPHYKQFVTERFAKGIKTRKIFSTDAEFIKKDGSTIFLEINGGPLFDADNNLIGRIGSARDVTRRREAERYRQELEVKALNQAKMASLGEIATGIAHEINQPLSFIKVIYESTLNDFELNQENRDELKEDFTEALRQVSRITHIINHLRTFGHSENRHFENISMQKIMDSTMILMGPKINNTNIILHQEIDPNLPPAFGNSINLEQVFINLIQNSINAMVGMEEGEINIRMTTDGNRIVIRYCDNGPGVPVEIQDRIFEPFFTTSEVGQGTGLGLAITFGIVQEHNGTIDFESTPGAGVTFTITLPVASEEEITGDGGQKTEARDAE